MPDRNYPREVGTYHFKVEVDGTAGGFFKDVQGLTHAVETIPQRTIIGGFQRMSGMDSSSPQQVRVRGWHRFDKKAFTGKPEFRNRSHGNVTLKRGILSTLELWDWRKAVTEGQVQKRDVRIVLEGRDGQRTEFELRGCLPLRWEGGQPSGSSEVAVESLQIEHESFRML